MSLNLERRPAHPSVAAGALAQLGYFTLLATLFHPFFFFIFRLMAFNTVPRDEYAPYLLWLLHEPGAGFPGSLYAYRILSVLAAAPFYYLLPALPLTNLPAELTPTYLKATAALAAVSYLAILAGAVIAYRLVVVRFARPPMEGLFAAAVLVLCEFYAAFYGIDPLAFLLVVCALYAIDRIWLFAAIMAASVLFNEKVLILFALWFSVRFVFSAAERRFFGKRLIVVAGAVAAYVAMLAILRLEGHSEQLDANAYAPTLLQNVVATVTTPRGFLLNVLPCVLLAGAVWWSWRTLDRRRCELFAPADLLVVPALIVITLVLTQYYQVGRIVMHAAPLFVVPVARALATWMRRGSSRA
jgi:hypothetical protein